MEGDRSIAPGSKLEGLGDDETLQERPQHRAVLCDPFRPDAEDGGEQTRVQEVQLGRLDQPFEVVAEPRLDPSYQKQLFEHADVATHGLVVETKLCCQLREVS